MRIPFSLKVGFTTTLLAASVTSGGLFLFYSYAYNLLLGEITGRLRDVGYLGTLQFDDDILTAIETLKEVTAAESQLAVEEIRQIPPGDALLSLDEETFATLQQEDEYQSISQLLRRIDQVGSRQIAPAQDFYPQLDWQTSTLGLYLMAEIPGIPDFQQVQFIGSSRHEAIDDWPGNPLGNVYSITDPTFAAAFGGEAQSTGLYSDSFGTWISTLVPVLDQDGRVVAVLGLDYDATNEANQLAVLRLIGLGIVGASFLLSAGGSVLLARWVGSPLKILRHGAERVRAGDYRTQVSLTSQDEFGLLAETFNSMVDEIRTQAETLESEVANRTAELAEANQAISTLNQQLQNENRRMEAELQVTRRLQQMILPGATELSEVPDLDIAGFMEPANEVGGDYYDVLVDHGQIKIGIGDVTGHGLQSGVLMLMVQTAVRTLLVCNERDPIKFLTILNRVIYDNIQRMNADKNLTLSLVDYRDGSLRLSGSHEEMIVVRSNGDLERINTMLLGIPIGLDQDITHFVDQTEVKLEQGDVVVLYTDGITEANNLQGEMYGLDRLCAVIGQYRHLSSLQIQKAVIADLRDFIGSQEIYDDITLLVMKKRLPMALETV
ncbi:MAG: SpoIIE family protein phosphatase [Synechococcaceae cyanobacterium SM2_3_2]|nr:SpoIIE family protein phosphatase [Synechococcaceae cyanobacterium SM2_3_2]